MIQEFIPEMIKRNEGHLVAIASSSAFIGLSNASLYASTKHAVLGYTSQYVLNLQKDDFKFIFFEHC